MSLNDRKQNIRHNSYFEAYPLMKLFPEALHWLKAKRSAGLAASLQALISVFIMGVLLFGGATARADTVTYIHSDLSGSPQAATDESGNLLWRESYYAYGQKTQWQAAADEQSQWFHGKEQDADTGMQYFGARYYDPSIGRFLGIDPVDYKDGNLHSFNRYAYGNNNPVKFRDPNGAYAEAAFEAISLAVGLDSLGKNYVAGNYGAATVDAAGIVADTVLMALPVAPGVVGLAIKASRESAEQATTRVGRWMSQTEYDAMRASGRVQESLSGTTHVASPADATAFINQAKPGSQYVEFNVPTSSLKATNEGWSKIVGPNSLEGRLAARKGQPIPQMPQATDITHTANKLPQ